MLWHGEHAVRGRRHAGHVTSGAYGHTLGAAVGLAWVHGGRARGRGGHGEVRGRQVLATLSEEPFYDPKGDRLRS